MIQFFQKVFLLFFKESPLQGFLFLCVAVLAVSHYYIWKTNEEKFAKLEASVMDCHNSQIKLLSDVVERNTIALYRLGLLDENKPTKK